MGGIYCYANFFCYDNFPIVFGPNLRGAKVFEGANCLRGAPTAPRGRSQLMKLLLFFLHIKIGTAMLRFSQMQFMFLSNMSVLSNEPSEVSCQVICSSFTFIYNQSFESSLFVFLSSIRNNQPVFTSGYSFIRNHTACLWKGVSQLRVLAAFSLMLKSIFPYSLIP